MNTKIGMPVKKIITRFMNVKGKKKVQAYVIKMANRKPVKKPVVNSGAV